MKKIRTAVIGQGRAGYDIHVAALKKMNRKYDIAAVCDPVIEQCKDARETVGCEVYSDYREMLKRDDLDLVVNTAPTHLHVPITLDIVDAGFNAVCEKPLTNRLSDVDLLIDRVERKGVLLTAFNQARFAPYFRQVRKVIASGVLGRIVMVKLAMNDFSRRWDWQTLKEYQGGNLSNIGSHALDQALTIFGNDVMPNILCTTDAANTLGDSEDHAKIILHGHGRPTIDVEVSSCCAYPLYTYQVYGTRGGLTGSSQHIDWKYFRPEESVQRHLASDWKPGREYCEEELKWHAASWTVPKSQSQVDYMALRFYSNVYDALTKGAELEIPPADTRQQIAVMEECRRQSQAGDREV